MSSTTAPAIVNTMKNVYARWGIPDLVISDNGGQFDSTAFTDFAESYGFCHETSSPKFQQSNGEVESAVQIAKSILRQPDPQLALMTYRSTPVAATGHSPSELMMGCRIRTTLPVLRRQLKPYTPCPKAVEDNDTRAKQEYARQYDRRHGVKELAPL